MEATNNSTEIQTKTTRQVMSAEFAALCVSDGRLDLIHGGNKDILPWGKLNEEEQIQVPKIKAAQKKVTDKEERRKTVQPLFDNLKTREETVEAKQETSLNEAERIKRIKSYYPDAIPLENLIAMLNENRLENLYSKADAIAFAEEHSIKIDNDCGVIEF